MFRSLIPASVLLVAVVAACGGTAATPVPTTAPTPTPTASPSPSPAPTLGFSVSLAPAGFFVGPNGMTLYTFDNDTPGTSNCQSGKCHDNWPPLALATGTELATGAGLSASDFGTIAWPDGTTQVTFKDIPLYYFAGDQAIGDTNGEGVGGVWHTATKQSTLPVASIEPSASPTATASVEPSTEPTATTSPEASGCFDNDGYATACPSGAPSETTVSTSAEGNLVNAAGMSLYTFDADTTADATACTSAECVANWPALTVESGQEVSVGEGLDAEDFTTFARTDDQATQVAFYAKPLYTFAGDTAAGDTNGDGVGGVWHLAKSGPNVSVSADGNLVNAAGWSLYTFDNDTTPGSSACASPECVANWPALTVGEGATPSIGEGLDQEDFTTFVRTDNQATQVAYYDKPLYTFAGDTAAGDTNGDGVGGVWHLAKPQ